MDRTIKIGAVTAAALLLIAAQAVAQDRGDRSSRSGSSASNNGASSDDDASRHRSADAPLSKFKDGTPPRAVSQRSDKDERKHDSGSDTRGSGRGTGYRQDSQDSRGH